jgi:hypothetical protein
MLMQSLVFDNVSAISMNLAAMAIGWSWWTAFRLVVRPVEGTLQAPSCLISGFGQA